MGVPKSKKSSPMWIRKGRSSRNEEAAILKERWICTSIYCTLCHTCYSISSSQQLYELQESLSSSPFCRGGNLSKLTQLIRTEPKVEPKESGSYLLWFHTQLRYITGAHINSSASDKQNRWRGDILIRFLGALKILRTLFERLWKMKKGFPLIP